jgi:transposase
MITPETEPQIQELDTWIKSNPDPREIKRALAVKLALSGWSCQATSDLLQISNGFISKWKKRYKESGIEGLRLSYNGKRSYLSDEQKQETIVWIQQQEFWDLSELECYLIEQFDVLFQSPASYYALLKEARITWQKAQKKSPKKDPELVKQKNQEIREVIEVAKPRIEVQKVVVYALDESHLLEGNLISHLFGRSQNRLYFPLDNEKNRQTYYGALNLCNPKLVLEKYPAGNGENTVDFLKKLIARHPEQQLIIFWDGATYHKGKIMREFLTQVNANLEPSSWKVYCHLFAPYAPEENPIESVWLELKRLLRRCYRFCKDFSIIKRLFEMFVKYQLFNFPRLENYDAFLHLI